MKGRVQRSCGPNPLDTRAAILYNEPNSSYPLGWGENLLTQEVNVMRSAQDSETIKLYIGKDGTLRIPAHVVSTAQLQAGDEVTVRIKPKQLAVVGSIMPEELLAQFAGDTQRLLAHVNEVCDA